MKKIVSGRSKIAGLGIFAGEIIRKGEVIAYLRGRKRHLHIRSKRDARVGPVWIGISARTWIDPLWPFSRINHSCDPSAGFTGLTTCRARRALLKGEEITIDYATTESSPYWSMTCSCRAKNCRKVIRSVQFLPYHVFKSYLPYIPTYFQNVYRNAFKKKYGNKKA